MKADKGENAIEDKKPEAKAKSAAPKKPKMSVLERENIKQGLMKTKPA